MTLYLLSPNGTQWLCGTNLWPWLPPQWIRCCTLIFPWILGHIHTTLKMILAIILCWKQDGLGQSFTGVIIWQLFYSLTGTWRCHYSYKALTKFTQQALNDSQQAVSLLNSEVSLMREAVLQNQMAWLYSLWRWYLWYISQLCFQTRWNI